MSPEQFEKGLEVRRAVMGDAFVERALANLDDFSRPLQELVTGYAWGEIWTRPGLDRRTRSLINLAMLTALNRGTEFKGHVRGAINNGCTREEIVEVLLQAAVYCGMPAGVEAFRNAREVLDQIDAERAGGSQ
ncbi:4-carboxymuconolactone decarboxylase [Plasticicumulans sp.]|uniref:4-carboxymuconolactone decarboxylase n=1 Tax=Plasticicumulans sp. TaxID=2307179 RepID=UPI002C1C470F|nr:4-carboxymuconolactone decarboxylase [Plasticicumulans sp.]MBS0600981.1 4-carboxymuconolactone decarboxylase [Pseudomonadota bacterium]HMV37698.1 4-carboxymuconolactone decarboxylase [Plasticicumulans sp.]HMW28070.1 4-carboxymuconolactone decarboxylase [Plasticicumulans sp.]HMW41235.1 4-carboxymuconolactone decarboxylase [Plasticicumulans sp.]HMZ09685.1 4-carboxymuconolactone decarboxylase [Plasticicumulans sp.]